MPYRADADALRTRCELLEKELADVRDRARELESLKRTETDVARELAAAKKLLESLGARGKDAPSLDGVRIASPCKASWDDMVGDERVRFCGKCEKNVYDLSAMSRDDAEALLRENEGSLCARIFRRADGTVMTSDCPVGVRTKRVRRLAIVAAGGGALAALAGVAFGSHRQGGVQIATGEIEMMGDVGPSAVGPSSEMQATGTMGSVAAPVPDPPAKPSKSPKVIHPEPKRR